MDAFPNVETQTPQAVYTGRTTVVRTAFTTEKYDIRVPFTEEKTFFQNNEQLAEAYFRATEGIKLIKCDKTEFNANGKRIWLESGKPDFWYKKDGSLYFMEIKRMDDGLRYSQIKWRADNPEVNFRLVYIEATMAEEEESIPWIEDYYKQLGDDMRESMIEMCENLIKKYPTDPRYVVKLKEIQEKNGFS